MNAHVYYLRNAAGQYLYIGMSSNIKARLRAHRYDRRWRHELARVDVSEEMPRAEAEEFERREIFRLQPLHNIADKNGLTTQQIANAAYLALLAELKIRS